MKKLWALALIFLLAPIVGTAQVQKFERGNEVIEVRKLWSSPVRSVAVDEQKRIYIGGDIFNPAPRLRMSADSGKTWTPDGGLDPYATVFAFALIDSGYVLAGTETGIFRSKDHGVSWQRVFHYQPLPFGGGILNLLVAKDKSIFAGAVYAIFRSTDNSNSWIQVADSTIVYPYVETMTQTPLNGVILAGCLSGNVNNANGVIRSTDNGRTWAISNTGLPVTNGKINIRAMTSQPFGFSPYVYLVTEYDGAFFSDDEGQRWKSIPIPNKYGAAAFTSVPLGVFLGFNFPDKDGYTLYRSYGAGGWLPIPGIVDWVGCMTQWSASQILVGTSTGLYLVSFYNPTKVENESIPTAYSLSQNYPNPFNPSTTIEFALPHRDFVKLTIHNLIGQEVAVLVNEEKGAGTHRVVWNAGVFPSGVYLCRIETTSGFVAAKKMLLVK